MTETYVNEVQELWMKSTVWVNIVIICWLWEEVRSCADTQPSFFWTKSRPRSSHPSNLEFSVTSETAGMLITGQSKRFPISPRMAIVNLSHSKTEIALHIAKSLNRKNVCYTGTVELLINTLMLCGIFSGHSISVYKLYIADDIATMNVHGRHLK